MNYMTELKIIISIKSIFNRQSDLKEWKEWIYHASSNYLHAALGYLIQIKMLNGPDRPRSYQSCGPVHLGLGLRSFYDRSVVN